MWLFGPAKVRITAKNYVKQQLDQIFSDEFARIEGEQHNVFSESFPVLQTVSVENYIKEKRSAIGNIVRIAFDRNVPYSVFVGATSYFSDDPRFKAVDNDAYFCFLSRAQELGMSTFGYMSMVFLSQIIPQNVMNAHRSDIEQLLIAYEMQFTTVFENYTKLTKGCKFI